MFILGYFRAFALFVSVTLLAAGCGKEIDVFPEPGNVTESAEVIRLARTGCVIVSYSSYPLSGAAPPDGVSAAIMAGIGNRPCSAASFFWSEKTLAERWIREQLALRRRAGLPQRLILAGHGLGATEAAETAKNILAREPEAELVLLLTVDAIKTGRLSSTAGATGTAIANKMPGIKINLVSYDAAPLPDGQRFWAHINYYQENSAAYHGMRMPGAENHRLDDWSGFLTHSNADNFAMPLLTADIRSALKRISP